MFVGLFSGFVCFRASDDVGLVSWRCVLLAMAWLVYRSIILIVWPGTVTLLCHLPLHKKPFFVGGMAVELLSKEALPGPPLRNTPWCLFCLPLLGMLCAPPN